VKKVFQLLLFATNPVLVLMIVMVMVIVMDSVCVVVFVVVEGLMIFCDV